MLQNNLGEIIYIDLVEESNDIKRSIEIQYIDFSINIIDPLLMRGEKLE